MKRKFNKSRGISMMLTHVPNAIHAIVVVAREFNSGPRVKFSFLFQRNQGYVYSKAEGT
jgi:hypothetical protein